MNHLCPCACHNPHGFGACSVNGGCDTLHTDDPSTRCYRGPQCGDARKRAVELDDGTTRRYLIPEQATEPGLLCRLDTTLVRSAVQQLPMDYLELSTLLGKTLTIEAPTSGTRELPVPIRLGIAVLADAILDELERWAERLADSVGMWYVAAGTRGDRIRFAGGWLAGLPERLLRLPATWHMRLDPTEQHLSGKDSTRWEHESGLDGALRLLDLHERTTMLAGRGRRPEHLNAPCPACGRLALEHDEGASHVDCRRCGERMSLDRYERHAGVLTRFYEQHPRSRPAQAERRKPRHQDRTPTGWRDGSVHDLPEHQSNMMLRYLDRHPGAAA